MERKKARDERKEAKGRNIVAKAINEGVGGECEFHYFLYGKEIQSAACRLSTRAPILSSHVPHLITRPLLIHHMPPPSLYLHHALLSQPPRPSFSFTVAITLIPVVHSSPLSLAHSLA